MTAPLSLVLAVAFAQAAEPAEHPNRVTATLYGFSVPDEPDFLMVVASAERGPLHVEGRYNYEGLYSGSVFVGLTGRGGGRVHVDATGMLGVAFGDVHGLVPAARLTLSWWKLDLVTEAESLFDPGDPAAAFFYSWSEIGVSPRRWLRLALVGQRTRVIHDALDLQRGVAASVIVRETLTLSAYELNLGWISPTYIAAVGVAL